MKFILGLLLVAAGLIIGIIMLVRRGPSEETPQPITQKISVVDYVSTAATAIYTVEGELNAEEEHQGIRISVSRNLRTLEILKGYNQTVAQTHTFPNTESAFDEFLHALENAGFSSSQKARYESDKGVCPMGRRTIYELKDLGNEVLRLWSTSCRRTDGSFAGNTGLIKQLFEKQIPEYRTLTKEVRL